MFDRDNVGFLMDVPNAFAQKQSSLRFTEAASSITLSGQAIPSAVAPQQSCRLLHLAIKGSIPSQSQMTTYLRIEFYPVNLSQDLQKEVTTCCRKSKHYCKPISGQAKPVSTYSRIRFLRSQPISGQGNLQTTYFRINLYTRQPFSGQDKMPSTN